MFPPSVHEAGISYIYFDHRDALSLVDLLRSVLKQILQRKDADIMSPTIRHLHNQFEIGSSLSLANIMDPLISESRNLSKLFVVIDALDESQFWDTEEMADMFSYLRKLSGLRLLVTSRPHVDITLDLDSYRRLDILAKESDLRAFIGTKFRRTGNNLVRHGHVDATTIKELTDGIVEKSDGMYVYELFCTSELTLC
jgi:hypothetical protein